ncbi:MAG: ATP-binding protein [Candidatus Marinimicrobia bacterium]|nr:ATP-binding protein [Candidatus Neomarinimicrobiota bacterium]
MTSFEKQIKPITLTVGTTVNEKSAPGTVYGRDELVEKLWDDIKSSSISLIGERRTGKTWVLRLAQALKPAQAETFWFDAEKVHSTIEFVRRLNQELHAKGLMSKNVARVFSSLARRIGFGLEGIKGTIEIKNPDEWPLFLQSTIGEFVQYAGNRNAVLMIDELPLCLDSIASTQGHAAASKVLDELRALRMAHPSLRMVFCGSLGLHIVLKKLEDEGYKGQPTNDLITFDVPPLNEHDSLFFAAGLIFGEKIGYSHLEQVSLAVAQAGSQIPYYIQHIVKYMKNQQPFDYTPEDVAAIPEKLFEASGDPARFRHHDKRLDVYYPEDIVEKARSVLDVLSLEPDGLDDGTLLNLVKHNPKTLTIDPEFLQEVVRILQDDHYIEKSGGRWKFKVDIIRRWWAFARGEMN